MQYISNYLSPLGNILLASDGSGLIGAWFEGQKYFAAGLDKDHTELQLPVFEDAKMWLDIYFSGCDPEFELSVHFSGTDFQKDVWKLLLTIPYGKTTTYGDIAKIIASKRGVDRMSARAVGSAIGRNPISIIVPCHRVVGSDGAMTGYAGGLVRKKVLLELEQKDK